MAKISAADALKAKAVITAALTGDAGVRAAMTNEHFALLSSEEVIGAGVGLLDPKDEGKGAAVVIYAKKSLSRDAIALFSQAIAITVQGETLEVPVRLELSGEFFATPDPAPADVTLPAAGLGYWALVDSEYRRKVRPVPAGYSVGTSQWSGTIGLIVINDPGFNQLYIASNNHVLNKDNSNGFTEILQPGGADGGIAPRDTIGRVDRFMRLSNTTDNYMDAATAIPNSNSLLDPRYGRNRIIVPGHYVQYSNGWRLWKAGRTTGDVEGVVDSVHTDTSVNYGGYGGLGTIGFKDQTIVKAVGGPVSLPGDSGSCWLRKGDNYACAINYAGPSDGMYSICFPVNWFISAFKCRVARPGALAAEQLPKIGADAALFSRVLVESEIEMLASLVEYAQ